MPSQRPVQTPPPATPPDLAQAPSALVGVFTARNKKRILSAFKKYEAVDVQLAILSCVRAGDVSLPLYLLEMEERGARVHHRFCWACVAQVESRDRFVEAIKEAPRSSVYLLLAELANLGNLPRLFLVASELQPSERDLYMAICHATAEGVSALRGVGAPAHLPPIHGKFRDSPLGRATRADDRTVIRTMLLDMAAHGVDPGLWLSRNRKDLPAWAYRTLKAVWTTIQQGQQTGTIPATASLQ